MNNSNLSSYIPLCLLCVGFYACLVKKMNVYVLKIFISIIYMTFKKELESINIEPNDYIKIVKQKARDYGIDPLRINFSNDKTHKLCYNDGDRKVCFGSKSYPDYIIYTLLNKEDADKKRKQYLARATKIKGDWKSDKYSKNNLAIHILW